MYGRYTLSFHFQANTTWHKHTLLSLSLYLWLFSVTSLSIWASHVLWSSGGQEGFPFSICHSFSFLFFRWYTDIHKHLERETSFSDSLWVCSRRVFGLMLQSRLLASLSHILAYLSYLRTYLTLSRWGRIVVSDLVCLLYPQRCELCPHKDGALKRTDNGGRISLLHTFTHTYAHT